MKRKVLMFCIATLLVCSLCGCVALPGENPSYPGESQNHNISSVPGSEPESKPGSEPESEPESKPESEPESKPEPEDTNSEDPALTALQQKINYHSKGAGVAFIGYVDSESSEVDLRAYYASSETGKVYPDLVYAPLYMAEGQELYAIVPPCAAGGITVYASAMNENGQYADDREHPLHSGKPGEPLLLRCNLSEIYSNVLISATDGGGAILYRPSVSLENGHLATEQSVYDFSIYEETPDERSVQIATEILSEADEVKLALENGMKIMYTGDMQMIEGRTCLLFALGTDSEGQFVRERYYGVCDNLIYVYDAVSDTWAVLGRM